MYRSERVLVLVMFFIFLLTASVYAGNVNILQPKSGNELNSGTVQQIKISFGTEINSDSIGDNDGVCEEIIGDLIGDDDGVCETGEACTEIIGDLIGDDDGVCETGEACTEIIGDVIGDDDRLCEIGEECEKCNPVFPAPAKYKLFYGCQGDVEQVPVLPNYYPGCCEAGETCSLDWKLMTTRYCTVGGCPSVYPWEVNFVQTDCQTVRKCKVKVVMYDAGNAPLGSTISGLFEIWPYKFYPTPLDLSPDEVTVAPGSSTLYTISGGTYPLTLKADKTSIVTINGKNSPVVLFNGTTFTVKNNLSASCTVDTTVTIKVVDDIGLKGTATYKIDCPELP